MADNSFNLFTSYFTVILFPSMQSIRWHLCVRFFLLDPLQLPVSLSVILKTASIRPNPDQLQNMQLQLTLNNFIYIYI